MTKSILNKIDALSSPEELQALLDRYPTAIPMSAKMSDGFAKLTSAASDALSREFWDIYVELPLEDGKTVAALARDGEILSREYDASGIARIHARLPKRAVERLRIVSGITVRLERADAEPYFETRLPGANAE